MNHKKELLWSLWVVYRESQDYTVLNPVANSFGFTVIKPQIS